MTSTNSSLSGLAPGGKAPTPWRAGTYLTDGTRLLCVVRVDAEGAEIEDARTEQLEWHPVPQLVGATRPVTPRTIP
jgi:hypothetical protein